MPLYTSFITEMFLSLFIFATATLASALPSFDLFQRDAEATLKPRQSCENTATSRDCWGDYSIDTNFYVSS